ncbi:MAG: hypothetical protein ISS41_07365 [Candidatus Aminicenantes bacterium]|nr:hypothetical protein [Candidatus Aminicenantes bacterium]
MLNVKKKFVHEKANGTLEYSYEGHHEIVHLERLFEEGDNKEADELIIRRISSTAKSFILFCTDLKAERSFRFYITPSNGISFDCTVTEFIFKEPTRIRRIIQANRGFKKSIEEEKKAGNEEMVKHLEELIEHNLKCMENYDPEEEERKQERC